MPKATIASFQRRIEELEATIEAIGKVNVETTRHLDAAMTALSLVIVVAKTAGREQESIQ